MKRKSTYQQKIIRNYYENRDSIMLQSLSEIVSELYLCSNDRKRDQLWKRAEAALEKMGTQPAEIKRIMQGRDLGALAKLVSREF